jgi:hypothetical protein
MAIYRVDVLVNNPNPVFEWIAANVDESFVVRKMAYETIRGWYVKTVFKRQSDAESFHRRWHPESDSHVVAPFA